MWHLFLDDLRDPTYVAPTQGYNPDVTLTARNVREALDLIDQRGMPSRIYFDHDLGTVGDRVEESVELLTQLTDRGVIPNQPCPEWFVHSDNGPGRRSIESRMGSWDRFYQTYVSGR